MKVFFSNALVLYLAAYFNFASAQNLNHEIFIKEIKNSNNRIYSECIDQYDNYLKKFPDDVLIHLEMCKFIQNAQYDEYEEYNPNQEQFDSCYTLVIKKFPNHPEVLVFQSENEWGEALDEVFQRAENSINEYPLLWGDENKGKIYEKIATNYFWNDDNFRANQYMIKAINHDKKYKTSLNYIRILINLNKKAEALEALLSDEDTTNQTWQLSQKASLLLELEAYSDALDIYHKINEIDTSYNNNQEIANTLEGVGKYNIAREYLVADTSQYWSKEDAMRRLLIHDIKYQTGEVSIKTYNEYRDYGYLQDPLAIYRLQLFISSPLQGWRFRDLLGLFTLLLGIAVLIIIPSIWVLPIYFVGHKWNLLKKNSSTDLKWGLFAFWMMSAGYLIATFFASALYPINLYSYFNSSTYSEELTQVQIGRMSIVFILVLAAFGFASLYKKDLRVLLSRNWTILRSVGIGIGFLFLFRVVAGIYIRIGVNHSDVEIDNIAKVFQVMLSSREEVMAIIGTYGKFAGFLILGLLVPVYEEIIFRGVILDACQRYTNFIAANLIQAVLFATIHMDLFLFPIFFLFAIVTGILRKKSEGLLPGIVFHMGNNMIVVLALFLR